MNMRAIVVRRRGVVPGVLLCCAALTGGCTLPSYEPGKSAQYYVAPEQQAATGSQIERGAKRPILDGVGWVIGIPQKIILWDRRIDNHSISPETEQKLADYLACNDLTAVKVRLNEYAPGDEWRRLVANKSMAWGWRYSLGTVSWLGYTVFPGRVFGGDAYNPYTNSIYLYSDVPAVAFHEGGHARYWAEREYKGNHAAVYALLPGASLYYEAVATGDALAYLHEFGSTGDQRDGYEILYPAYGTYVGGLITAGPLELAPVLAGHVVGRVESWRIEDPHPAEDVLSPEPEAAPLPPAARLTHSVSMLMPRDAAFN